MSSPPPIGGNLRTINVNVDPDRLKAYKLTLDDLTAALNTGNLIIPSGNVRVGDQTPIVPLDGTVTNWQEIGDIPIKPGVNVYIRDVAQVEDGSDIAVGYAMVNGKRTVYLTVTKRADASTLDVVNLLKENLPRMQEALPPDVKLKFEFDQSPYVTHAMQGVGVEGMLGAVLTGLMVLVFLRDWRSVVVVVLNIPLALMGALVALWATGQTVNLMTLGGLALAVGILVDEATVEVENIHTQLEHTDAVAVAVRREQLDGRAAAPGDVVHPGGVRASVLHAGFGSKHVRSPGAVRRLRHDHQLHPFEHVRAGGQRMAAP